MQVSVFYTNISNRNRSFNLISEYSQNGALNMGQIRLLSVWQRHTQSYVWLAKIYNIYLHLWGTVLYFESCIKWIQSRMVNTSISISLSTILHHIALRHGLSLNCKLTVVERLQSSGELASPPLDAEITDTHSNAWPFCTSAGELSLVPHCLQSKHSCPQNHHPTPSCLFIQQILKILSSIWRYTICSPFCATGCQKLFFQSNYILINFHVSRSTQWKNKRLSKYRNQSQSHL